MLPFDNYSGETEAKAYTQCSQVVTYNTILHTCQAVNTLFEDCGRFCIKTCVATRACLTGTSCASDPDVAEEYVA